MKYDNTLEIQRLEQLASQHLMGIDFTGKVVFLSDQIERRLDVTSWHVDDSEWKIFNDKNFKIHLIELLDSLIMHRANQGVTESLSGVVTVDKQTLNIEWLSTAEAEKQRQSAA